MSEFMRGFLYALCLSVPVIGLAVGKWHFYKGESKFWKMMHKDLRDHNEQLFEQYGSILRRFSK